MAQSTTSRGEENNRDDSTGPFPIPEGFQQRPPVPAMIYLVLHESGPTRPLRDVEIAAATGRSKPSIEYHLKRLHDDGLIEKRPDARDPRFKLYSLP